MNQTAPDTVLSLRGIHKKFGSVAAIEDVSIDLKAGEVLALLGENGAGKSTLMSILFGHYTADSGSIEVFGRPLPPGQPRAALAAGIGMVHQHFALADNLSVLDNIILGTEPLWQPFSRRRAARARLLAVAERFGLPVDADARVGTLSVGERQRVEILKALYRGARILILDEPTAVLTPQACESLFATLALLVAQGLSVIFISHKLAEVLRVAHRLVVLRRGSVVAQAATAGTSAEQLADWMVGRPVGMPRRTSAARVGATVSRLRAAFSEGGPRDCLRGVSLDLRAGEITAIAGVSGNGQLALAEVLCGTRRLLGGTARLLDLPLQPNPARLARLGVARIPEDRQGVGAMGDLPVWENAVSEQLRSPAFHHFGWVRRGLARAHAAAIVKAFDVRGGGLDAPARTLSGGNLQKLLLGRALLPAPGQRQSVRLLVAHQPTWGLDIGAVAAVRTEIIAARIAGAAVLVISDDLDEVIALGDRVAVMHQGRLSVALPGTEWSRAALGLAMAGAGNVPDSLAASTEISKKIEKTEEAIP